MTPPALIVLSVALACTITGTAPEKAADLYNHTNKQEPIAKNMDWTNINNIANSELNRLNNTIDNVDSRKYDKYLPKKRAKREDQDPRCEYFQFNPKTQNPITHPRDKDKDGKYYSRNTDCVTVISANEGNIIKLTFVDVFRIEAHPDCAHDYIEIRDGQEGYAELLHKVCGETFPAEISSTSPHLWLKFHSDDTIEYEGFHINVDFIPSPNSHSIPESCTKVIEGRYGSIDSDEIDSSCTSMTENRPLDVLWMIVSPDKTKIDLNFTTYSLAKPNECKENMVQVFGSILEDEAKLAHYCGSVANSVSTKDSSSGNIMHVRLYTTKTGKGSKFSATFTAFRTLDSGVDKCNDDEFDCEDNTCIDVALKCNDYANCKLKADEEGCHNETKSQISEPHILVILVIFSLILSGMSFIFLFKCIKKLYQDHKAIKDHIRQSCEDRLDMVGNRLTLDAKRLQRDSEPRAISLERENHTNEMYKQQRNRSQHKDMSNGTDSINIPFIQQTSIDSDYLPEHQLDIDDELGRREVETHPIETEEIRVERNGRTRRTDAYKREESIRSRTRGTERSRERKEIRDVSVGAPDTKESGCQTRESLFQTDQALSSDGSGTNSRGFSTFGYSGATIVRPSPPAPATNTTELTIELLKQVPRQDSKIYKKSDRRPMSTETTRSAPDVIIVSKPIR